MDSYFGRVGVAGKESLADLASQIVTTATCLNHINFKSNKFTAK